MKKLSKKLIRLTFATAMDQALTQTGVTRPSKKTKKNIARAVEKISLEVYQDLKKSLKQVKLQETRKERQDLKHQKSELTKTSKGQFLPGS